MAGIIETSGSAPLGPGHSAGVSVGGLRLTGALHYRPLGVIGIDGVTKGILATGIWSGHLTDRPAPLSAKPLNTGAFAPAMAA